MNPAGQWYYLSGSNPTGPIAQAKLFEMIKSGELIPSVQVAAAGWQQWQPASAVFPELASVAAAPSPASAAPTVAMSPVTSPSPSPVSSSTAAMPAASPKQTATTQTIVQPDPILQPKLDPVAAAAPQPKAEAPRPTIAEPQPSVSQARPSYQPQPFQAQPQAAPSPAPTAQQPFQPQPAFQPQPLFQPQPGLQPQGQFGAPAPTAIPAVQLRCLAGPDADKVFIISSAEVLLGRASGIGQADPALADQHLTLCWQNNALYYRMLGGQIRIDGVIPPPNGVLQLGQSFQMGSSIWQVNSQTATLGGLLDSLGKRLNSLASTEKLEGFSLSGMFSETFKKRAQEEVDEYFICGTSKTTPAIEKAVTGWPKPWFFMRVLIFLAATFFLFWLGWREFTNTNLLPGMMMIGAMVIPLAVVILFFELNTPRNVSFFNAIGLLCVGGVLSIFVALIGFQVSGLDAILGPPAAGVIEEVGKLITVIILARNTRQKYILNGLLFGACVGAGFAIFESAGYAFSGFLNPIRYYLTHGTGYSQDLIVFAGSNMTESIILRGLLSPFGHVAWTAIAAGALWRVKWDRAFNVGMLGNPLFWKAFLIPVALHMIWDLPIPNFFYIPLILNGIVSWYIVFGIVQQGLRQVKREQLNQTKEELARTQSVVVAVTSSHRAPVMR